MKRTQRFKYYLAVSISLITFIIYLSTLRNDFLTWDDRAYIVDNLHIRSFDMTFLKWAFFDFYALNWHPLTWISHALDYVVWGLNPLGHHLSNNILHTINTFLVVFLIMKLLETAKERTAQAGLSGFLTERTILIAGGVTGLLFGLHPLHVESVAWVSERKDLLCALFFLLSIIQYTNYVRSEGKERASKKPLLFLSNKHYLFTLAFFILALLSKPMAVSLPVVLLILDWYPLNRITSPGTFRSALIEKLPFLALSLASSIVTVFAQHDSMTSLPDVLLATRLLVAAKSLILYLEKMVWPLDLLPFYIYPNPKDVSLFSFKYLFAIALVAGITAACIVIVKKQRVWLTAWGYFVVTLIPVIGIVQVGYQSMADRYTYLPSLGPFLIVGLGAAWMFTKMTPVKKGGVIVQLLGASLALFIFIPMTSVTLKQIGIWEDSFIFWNYIIEREPAQSIIPYTNLGLAYEKKGLLDKAIEQFLITIKLNPDSSELYDILGAAYEKKGLLDKAIEQYQFAVRLAPAYARAHSVLGAAYEKKGALDQAVEQYQIIVQLDPNNAQVHNNLGVAYQKKGLPDRAIEQYQIAIRLEPDYSLALNNLGSAYESKDLIIQAIEQYQIAARLDPNYALPHNNLGSAYEKKGLMDQALEQYQIAVSLAPGYVRAHINLGKAYEKKGLLDQALEQYKTAVKLDPENPTWRKNLADAYEKKRRSE